jgi:hypothetical protein
VEVDCDRLIIALVYTVFFVLDALQNSHAAMILDGGVVAFSLEAARESGYYGL